jgi:hypothetical protein
VFTIFAGNVFVLVPLNVLADFNIANLLEFLLGKQSAHIKHANGSLALVVRTAKYLIILTISKHSQVVSNAEPAEGTIAVDEGIRIAHYVCANIALPLL